eukprot:jgi/Mesvir1/6190/Mv24163-RA.1
MVLHCSVIPKTRPNAPLSNDFRSYTYGISSSRSWAIENFSTLQQVPPRVQYRPPRQESRILQARFLFRFSSITLTIIVNRPGGVKPVKVVQLLFGPTPDDLSDHRRGNKEKSSKEKTRLHSTQQLYISGNWELRMYAGYDRRSAFNSIGRQVAATEDQKRRIVALIEEETQQIKQIEETVMGSDKATQELEKKSKELEMKINEMRRDILSNGRQLSALMNDIRQSDTVVSAMEDDSKRKDHLYTQKRLELENKLKTYEERACALLHFQEVRVEEDRRTACSSQFSSEEAAYLMSVSAEIDKVLKMIPAQLVELQEEDERLLEVQKFFDPEEYSQLSEMTLPELEERFEMYQSMVAGLQREK